ncbi:hypothetical protein [Actinoplanes sp. RD1]|uniref:hypothetical protein n=1 Tax=Actinoplanes sp. RD1 TaxID=3064538 RepID=UPI002740D8C9|nr:hypothetical protein [Actinoplanes sp. RD1]
MVAYGAEFHRLLLKVAGHAPAETLVAARQALARDRTAETALALGSIMAAAGLPPSEEEFALLGAAEPDSVEPLSETRPGEWPVPPLRFRPVAAERPDLPPVLDLTAAPAATVTRLTDAVDRTATAAAGRLPGARALWRTWRSGPQPARVFVLEAAVPAERLPLLTGTLQEELRAAGLPHPLIETYAPGDELPVYQEQAREGAALLWTADRPDPVVVARVFDGADPVTGPYFAPGHPTLAGAERDQVLARLDGGRPLLITTDRADDVVAPGRGAVVPLSYRTDGAWIWTDTTAYYLREHGLAPDPELLAHLRGAPAPEPDAAALHRALAALFPLEG